MLEDLASAAEIAKRVDRILKAADAYGRFPTPVDDIVAAAKLTQAADYVFDESAISKAPAHLRTLLRSARNKIQGLVDRRARVIHISPAIENVGRRRFVTLHETTHGILPHQQDLLYADDDQTLSPFTKHLFEREANQGAAELLFQRELFARDAAQSEVSIAAVWGLAERYGASFQSTIRRFAETHGDPVAAIALSRTPISAPPAIWQRFEHVTSKSWLERFGARRWPSRMSEAEHPFLSAILVPDLDQVKILDTDGNAIAIHVQVEQTPYRTFVLLWQPRRRKVMAKRRVTLDRLQRL